MTKGDTEMQQKGHLRKLKGKSCFWCSAFSFSCSQQSNPDCSVITKTEVWICSLRIIRAL